MQRLNRCVPPHIVAQIGFQQSLNDHNLLAVEETLQQIYDTIGDKSEKMVKYENAPRPDDF